MMREQLPPIVLQLVGLFGLVALSVFWAITDRLEASLLATFGSLICAGSYVKAIQALPKIGTNNG